VGSRGPAAAGRAPIFFHEPEAPGHESMGRKSETMGGIVPKMNRATIETWMYVAGIPMNEICLRQGHDKLTSLNHYQAISQAFTSGEIHEIKKRLAGWHTA